MNFRYSDEEYAILSKDMKNVLDSLFSMAKNNNQEIKGVAYNPNWKDGGLWMKMLAFNYVRDVWFEFASIEHDEFISNLSNNTCNVLFINQKILGAKPKVELFEAKNFNLKDELRSKFDYIVVLTDDAMFSLMTTDFTAECIVDKWFFNKL